MPLRSDDCARREGRLADSQKVGSFDYVIIGAGSAGCTLAARLTEDPSTSVLLIEAGGANRSLCLRAPAWFRYSINDPRYDWCLWTEPEPDLDLRRVAWPRGKGLGGSSVINGMIYTRGHAQDYERWRAAGADGWGWDDVLPYFRKSECHANGESGIHGGQGELHVQPARAPIWPFLFDLEQAALEAGLPNKSDFNDGQPFGVGWYDTTQRLGERWSTARAFLYPVMNRPNLLVLTEALALRVLLREKCATGVEIERDGQRACASAREEVILAAGVVHSPQLLELSGIGDPAILQAAGVEPRHVSLGVGANLQDHLQFRQIYRLSHIRTLNQELASIWGRAAIVLSYLLSRKGALAMAPSQLGIFAKSRPDKTIADLQYHIVPYSAERPGAAPHPWPGITMSVCQLDPQSRGSIHIRSSDPRESPAICANYLSAEDDRRVMIDGIQLTRKIMAAPALARYEPVEMTPGLDAKSSAQLLAAIRETAQSIYHPVGTCRMGGDARAVTDPALRVHGISRLRVVDASVMPTVPAANTNAATIMIAEKAAVMINRARRERRDGR